jgi:polyisoprenoid-binding protein YceI
MKWMTTSLLCAALAAPAATAAPVEYKIDSPHSRAQFSVRHMMVSNVRGDFSKITGTIVYDDANPAATRIDATIDASTINTSEPARDAHLRGADFFDVAKYPTMTFRSKSAARNNAGLAVTGDLTIHGVTKAVVLQLETPSAEVGGKRGATAATRINRKDFGLTWNRAIEAGGVAVGEEVSITIDIEAQRAR